MRPEAHAAALRSAAKLVLGVASLASITVACAATSSEEADSNSQAVTSNDESDDRAATDGGTLSAECQAKLDAAFPGTDTYQWTPVKEPKAVVACCNQAFANEQLGAGHRWACCVSYDKLDAHDQPLTVARQQHNMSACTPWGPPVPPRMNRRRTMSPARREMNVALTSHVGLVA